MFSAEMRAYDVPVPWKKNYDHVRESIWDKMAAKVAARGRMLSAEVPDPWERPWRQVGVEFIVILVLQETERKVSLVRERSDS